MMKSMRQARHARSMAEGRRISRLHRLTVAAAAGALALVVVGAASAQAARIEVGTAGAAPGERACVPILLQSGSDVVVGISNDIGFDTSAVSIDPVVDCEIGAGPLESGLGLECSAHSTFIRCGVFDLKRTVIPDGVAYQCCFTIVPSAAPGSTIPLANACGAANVAGDIPAACTSGEIQVVNATPTPTIPPSATPAGTTVAVPSVSPRATSTPLVLNTATHTPTRTPTNSPTRTPTASIRNSGCPGDCNDDGRVTISELVAAVNIALGNQSIDACPSADENEDGRVTVSELIRAVNSALVGCNETVIEIPGRCELPGSSGSQPCAAGTVIELFVCSEPERCLFDNGTPIWQGTCDGEGRFTARIGADDSRDRILVFRAQLGAGVTFRALDLSMVGEPWELIVIDLFSEAAIRLLALEGFAGFEVAGIREVLLAVLRALADVTFSGMAPAEAIAAATDTARQDSGTIDALRCSRVGSVPERCHQPIEEWHFEFTPDPGQGCAAETNTIHVSLDGASVSGRIQATNCLQVSCTFGPSECDEGVTTAELTGERSGDSFAGVFDIHYFGRGRCPSQNCSGQCACEATTDIEGTFAPDGSSISGRYEFRAGRCTGGATAGCTAGPCRHDRNRCVGNFTALIPSR